MASVSISVSATGSKLEASDRAHVVGRTSARATAHGGASKHAESFVLSTARLINIVLEDFVQACGGSATFVSRSALQRRDRECEATCTE